jgi:hypothetical protein
MVDFHFIFLTNTFTALHCYSTIVPFLHPLSNIFLIMPGRFDSSSNSAASSSFQASSSKRKTPGGNKSASNRTQNKPAGEKGTTSSGLPEVEITAEDMAIYKAIQAKLKGKKKAAAASHDEGK